MRTSLTLLRGPVSLRSRASVLALALCMAGCGGGSSNAGTSAAQSAPAAPAQPAPSAPAVPAAPDPAPAAPVVPTPPAPAPAPLPFTVVVPAQPPAVPGAPVISTQPASQAVVLGESATFTVAAGTGPLTYQWTMNGEPIVGATSASYRTSPVQAGDSGSGYRVTVSNASGSVTSAVATDLISMPGAWLFAGAVKSDNVYGSSEEKYRDAFGEHARFSNPGSLTVDGAGNLYVADFGNRAVRRVSPLGDVSTLLRANSEYTLLEVVAAAADGSVYVASPSYSGSSTVYKVGTNGAVSSFALPSDPTFLNYDGGFPLSSILYAAVDKQGNYHDVLMSLRQVSYCGTPSACFEERRYSVRTHFVDGTTRIRTVPREGILIDGMTADSAGNVYLTDRASVIWKFTPGGDFTIVAGKLGEEADIDGDRVTGRLRYPGTLCIDSADNLYIGEGSNGLPIRKLTQAGVLTTVLTEFSPGWSVFPEPREVLSRIGLAVSPGGTLYMVRGNAIIRIAPK